MIVPMKKVSLIVMGDKKTEALRKLRKLGIVHIEIEEGRVGDSSTLRVRSEMLGKAVFIIGKSGKNGQTNAEFDKALEIAEEIVALDKKRTEYQTELAVLNSELEKMKDWGDIDPDSIDELAKKGAAMSFFEMPKKEYAALPDSIKTVKINDGKSTVRFLCLDADTDFENAEQLLAYRLTLPERSSAKTKSKIDYINSKIKAINGTIASYSCYRDSIKRAIKEVAGEIEFETYREGMKNESLSSGREEALCVSYFKGYVESNNVEKLKKAAANNSWGLLIEEPTEEDNVPTKLKNNKFVSLIYPLTDFLGTVPGYFEYDISGWFLAFILIFFGIIFGDGGYGLLICAVCAVPILKALITKEAPSQTVLLIGLFGLSTVIWGTLTCTWFGLSPEQLPQWLKSLSVPVISNVNADRIWYPFWTEGEFGLTTAQNLQILCFSLALIQLTVAHIKCAIRNGKSFKTVGDIGSILQLFGMYYLVLSLVVNPSVFSFGLVIGIIPVGTVSVAMIAVGFVASFVFSNYEGSILKSVLSSLVNIVSVLLGVVNVFSDIVSYIRLWAVGLAGAAISATVNELASPLLGNFMFMILAIVLLVFGHGLNMILNVLSVIVHGIRLNTLEFSSHLGMSWSGHKFKPFEE